jgi:hypothetical protein
MSKKEKNKNMSLLNYLKFQEIDQSTNDIPEEHRSQDDISLDDPIDEASLERFWDQVVRDIHEDPEWFSFDND